MGVVVIAVVVEAAATIDDGLLLADEDCWEG